MSRQTGMTERVRAILRCAGEPLSTAQIIEALGDGHVERNSIASLLNQRVHAGEVRVSLQDKRAHYALVPGYRSRMPQRTPRAAAPFSPPAPEGVRSAPTAGPAPVASDSPAPPTTPKAATPTATAAPGNPIDADAHAAADRLIATLGQASAPAPAPAGITLRIHLDFGDLPAQLRALAATLDGSRAAP